MLFSLLLSLAGAAVPLAFGKVEVLSGHTFVLAMLFGLAIAAEQYVANESYRRGPMFLSSFLAQSGMLITIAISCLVWSERISLQQGFGVMLMLAAMALLLLGNKNTDGKKVNMIWAVFALLWMIMCGVLGILQKLFTETAQEEEILGFLFFSFLSSGVFLLIDLLLEMRKEKKLMKNMTTDAADRDEGKNHGITYRVFGSVGIAAVVSGLLYAGLHVSALIGVGKLESVYFFPVSNGLKLIAAVLAGAVLFKESVKKIQVVGIFIGLAAIVLLS